MRKAYLLFVLLAVLPMAALAGKEDDADAEDGVVEDVKDESQDPQEEPVPEKGVLSDLFNIPKNQTFEEWFEEQYESFKEKDYNEWQKKQFQDYERQRFLQWQAQKYQHKQQAKFRELQAEHNKYMMKKGKELERIHQKFLKEQEANAKAEKERHETWLKALLANPEDRAELMKDILAMDRKQNKEL